MNKKITVTGANKFFFIFTVLFIAFQFVLGFLAEEYGANFLDRNIYGIILVNEYILILIPILIYAAVNRLNFRELFRLNKPGVLPVIVITLLSVPAYFAASMLNILPVYLLQFLGKIPNQPIPAPRNVGELVVGLLIIGVSPAICEELLHRGMLLKAYERRGSMKAVVITGIFFGIFHFDITNLLGPVFLGCLIGYYVIRTNSIFVGMLAHFLSNSIAELLQFFGDKDQAAPANITVMPDELGAALVYGIAGLLLVWLFLKLFNRVTEGRFEWKPAIGSVKNDILSIGTHWPIIVITAVYLFIGAMTVFTIVHG